MPAVPKVAIVADWLTNMGGAEKVVLALHDAFPDAPIYTSVFTPETMPLFQNLDIRTTWIQKFPHFLRRLHRWFPVIQVWALRSLDLSDYDVILTSSILNSNQVRKTRPDQALVSYCHTPARYYWSHYDEYKTNPGFGALNWLVRLLIPLFVPHMRKLDYEAAQKVDTFIANSTVVQKRIKDYYGKPSTIIFPSVDVTRFDPARTRSDFYVTLGRQVAYKRYDLAVEAATKLGVKLKVFGTGADHERLVSLAGPTVSFYADRFGDASDEHVTDALNNAKGFIYSAEEDFGIVQVEALAAGAPVITLGRGGALDIVQDGESGVLFDEQTVDSVAAAIQKAESLTFMPATLNRRARRFDKSLFITKVRKVVLDSYEQRRNV